MRSLQTKRQLVDYQVEQQRQETLGKRIGEQCRRVDLLTLKAPAAGRVTARRLANLPGSYLAEGAELCVIVENGREFRLSIAQYDLPYFAARTGKPIQISLSGRTITGVVTSLDPQASTALSDPALSAAAGGPLAVIPNETVTGGGDSPLAWKLIEPRVTGSVTLSADDWSTLRAGERGSAAVHPPGYNVATVLNAWRRNWISSFHRRLDE